jgi:uncharacterized membrane protein YhaH (DUF805 family)
MAAVRGALALKQERLHDQKFDVWWSLCNAMQFWT